MVGTGRTEKEITAVAFLISLPAASTSVNFFFCADFDKSK